VREACIKGQPTDVPITAIRSLSPVMASRSPARIGVAFVTGLPYHEEESLPCRTPLRSLDTEKPSPFY
jgi:hypothetical protein